MGRTAKKATKSRTKASTAKKTAKTVDLQDVRQKVRNVVAERAVEMTKAVAEDVVKKAQLQGMKILFEMVGLFGDDAVPDAPPEDDQALAKVLLDRFNLPDFPMGPEEEHAPLVMAAGPEADSVK